MTGKTETRNASTLAVRGEKYTEPRERWSKELEPHDAADTPRPGESIGPPVVGTPWREPCDLSIEYDIQREPKRVRQSFKLRASKGALVVLISIGLLVLSLAPNGRKLVRRIVKALAAVTGYSDTPNTHR
jgi:hypothetical protein